MASVTDQIKERIDIVELISSAVELRRSGRNYVGFCPFHPNTKSPAFYVFPDTQSYHCFGCKASGTAFDFVMQREGMDFRDVLHQLAQRTGVQLQERTPEDEAVDQLRTRLLDINNAAARFFQHVLVKSSRGDAGRAYVAQRGFTPETIEAFQLGYAFEDWSALLAYLTDKRGYEIEDVEAAGLAIRREQGGYYDRFRNRLIFPIRSAKGEIISFGGRALGDAQPKYMNGPQTALFDKSHVLYGLDLARDAIRHEDAVIVVEGYVDVIIAHQYGFRNVVAPLGTALTREHVAALKKLTKRIFLALDADPAGMRATRKGIATVRAHDSGEDATHQTAAGYLRWEHETETEIRIIALPDGRDPDEVIQESPDLWRRLVADAKPMMDFTIAAVTAELDLKTAKGKVAAMDQLAPLIASVRNPVERGHHLRQIANLLNVSEQAIQMAASRTHEPMARTRRAPAPPAIADQQTSREDFFLAWMMRFPAARTAVQEKLIRDAQPFPRISDSLATEVLELIERPDNRALWQMWQRQPAATDALEWARMLEEPLRSTAERLLGLSLPAEQSYRFVNDALECATILQRERAETWQRRVSDEKADTDDDDQGLYLVIVERLIEFKRYIDVLSTPRRSSTYADLHALRTV